MNEAPDEKLFLEEEQSMISYEAINFLLLRHFQLISLLAAHTPEKSFIHLDEEKFQWIFYSHPTCWVEQRRGKKFLLSCHATMPLINIHFFPNSLQCTFLEEMLYKKYPQMTFFGFFCRSRHIQQQQQPSTDFTRFSLIIFFLPLSLLRNIFFFSFQIHQCQWRTIVFFFPCFALFF